MKLKDSLGGAVIIISLFLSSIGLTQQPKGSGNQGRVNEKEVYYFGLQANAPPISNNNGLGWEGYCYAFIETLKERIPEKIEIVSVKIQHRFTGNGDNGEKLDAECGPNTITPGRINKELKENGRDGTFSETFAWTGAKVLLPDKKRPDFFNQSKLKKLKFGVLGGTTTKTLVASIFPSVEQKNIVLLKDRQDAITKIKEGEVDAFFNDELLLNSVLKELLSSKNAQDYSLLPTFYSKEEYGIIVYHVSKDKNNNLLTAINDLLKQGEVKIFGDTQIQILKDPQFDEVIEDFKLPVKQSENGHSFSLLEENLYLLGFLTLIVIILIILINNQINRAKRSRGISQTRTQINNNSDNRNNEESRVAPLKSEYSPATPYIIVNNHTNVDSKNDNNQGDNMSERKTQINQNNSSFGVGYSEQVEANQLAANIHNYAPEQDLAKAAESIQQLLKQLEATNPTATQEDKQAFVTAAIPQEEKSRILRALQAGGEKALEKFLNNPYVDVTMAIVKEWQKGQE